MHVSAYHVEGEIVHGSDHGAGDHEEYRELDVIRRRVAEKVLRVCRSATKRSVIYKYILSPPIHMHTRLSDIDRHAC